MANEALRLIGRRRGGQRRRRAGEELNLRELWRALMRRKFLLLATILVITGGAFAYVRQQTAALHRRGLDPRAEPRRPGGRDRGRGRGADRRSGDHRERDPAAELARLSCAAIVEQLDLVDDPEFNPAPAQGRRPSRRSSRRINPLQIHAGGWLAALRRWRRGPSSPTPPTLDPADAQLNRVIDAFGGRCRGRSGRRAPT